MAKSFMLMLAVVVSLTACTAADRYQRHMHKYTVNTAWLPVSTKKATASRYKPSAKNLLHYAKKYDQGLIDVLKVNGKPDYVRGGHSNVLFLAYIERGVVLRFVLSSGLAPQVIPYQQMCYLPYALYQGFAQVDKAPLNDPLDCQIK